MDFNTYRWKKLCFTILAAVSLASPAAAQTSLNPERFVDDLIERRIDALTADYSPLVFAEYGRMEPGHRLSDWIRSEYWGDEERGERIRPTRSPTCHWQAINLGWGVALEASDINHYVAIRLKALAWLRDQRYALARAQTAAVAESVLLGAGDFAGRRADLARRGEADQWWRRVRAQLDPELEADDPIARHLISNFIRLGMCETDQANREFIELFFDESGWPTISEYGGDAERSFWLMVQHGPVELQERALPILEQLYPLGETNPRHYAMLFDRVSMRNGHPQRYGSQFECRNGYWSLYELEAPDSVNERRASMGMEPLEGDPSGIVRGECG